MQAVDQLRKFLTDFGFGSRVDVQLEIARTEADLGKAYAAREVLRARHESLTHPVDDLRSRLRALAKDLDSEREVLADLDLKISEQTALRAEYMAARYKLTRGAVASDVLAGVVFEKCPKCGQLLTGREAQREDECYLCGQDLDSGGAPVGSNVETARRDLQSRIDDLSLALEKHADARRVQELRVQRVGESKATLDSQLQQETRHYDSMYLAEARILEGNIGTLEERLRSSSNLLKLPDAVSRLEDEAAQLALPRDRLIVGMEAERSTLVNANNLVSELEDAFLTLLLEVGVPGVSRDDVVDIDRRNWSVSIYPKGDTSIRWGFTNAGSGGKKSLFNACYAVAIHCVATRHDLPLPTLLMIDTPMKNIGEDVNRDIFESFYRALYSRINGDLRDTQIILIDKEYFPPEGETVAIQSRYMTPDQLAAPPLIPYYRGP